MGSGREYKKEVIKMRKVNGYHTETFEYEMGFMIDLVTTPDCYYAWLYFKTCGIKIIGEIAIIFESPKTEEIRSTLIFFTP